MMYLQHDFYNIIFKIKHELYIALGWTPPPRAKNSGCAPGKVCDLKKPELLIKDLNLVLGISYN
jgi:glucose/arabinose dehydrogenase